MISILYPVLVRISSVFWQTKNKKIDPKYGRYPLLIFELAVIGLNRHFAYWRKIVIPADTL